MKSYCLKSATESALLMALAGAGYVDKSGRVIADSGRHSLVWIGAMISKPAVLDAYGKVIVEAVWCTGFHANLRLQADDPLPSGLAMMNIQPQTPSFQWL